MRRRTLVTVFLGLFTQMSGNTLLSYYSGLLFNMMGYTSGYAKTRINIANHCWSLMTSAFFALIVTRFRRRWMFMLSAASMCLVFISMTTSFSVLKTANDKKMKNSSAQIAALFFYFAYSPCYNLGNNALTYSEFSFFTFIVEDNTDVQKAYLVELWPYNTRSRGIGMQQVFGKLAGFFSTNVNPKALNALNWKYMAIYCGWIFFELIFVYLFYPETYNRTLEELAFCKLLFFCPTRTQIKSSFQKSPLISTNSVRGQGACRQGFCCRREADPLW